MKLRFYQKKDIESLPQLQRLLPSERDAMSIIAEIVPFRTNNYVVEQLIDWNNIPNDPIFQLTFLQKAMLPSEHFDRLEKALRNGITTQQLSILVNEIRASLNPHPSGQMTDNVPVMDEQRVPGIQHKYTETCLVFPANGQTCHAYCTYCFRWPQFVGDKSLKFATEAANLHLNYLAEHTEVSDVLFTGGDPMIMHAGALAQHIEPLLKLDHLDNIRIGTKSLAYWPYRYLTDSDADDLMSLFEKVVNSGKHLAIMAHFSHWKEISTPAVQQAIARIRNTGAEIRTQAPLMRHVNDSAEVWARMWKEQVRLGCIPYYMFIARDTGPQGYFEVPLHEAYGIFRDAFSQTSGLCRTVRGPSMSAHPGKVSIEGIVEVNGEKLFVLTFLQARKAEWCKKPFFARFDPEAAWFTDLKPAFGEHFFFESGGQEHDKGYTEPGFGDDLTIPNFNPVLARV